MQSYALLPFTVFCLDAANIEEPKGRLKTPAEQQEEQKRINRLSEKKALKSPPVESPSEKADKAPHPAPPSTPIPAPAASRPHPASYRRAKRGLVEPKSDARRAVEAEMRASKLAIDNARLQERVARRETLPSSPINTPEEAIGELKAGNARFVDGRRVRTLLSFQDIDLRRELVKGQKPFAAIVTCSDSRMVDNFLFDQEIGRLFTIREAGNCPDTQGIASVEYAVEHLGVKLVVLLGHSACGAVKAVAESGHKALPGNLWSLQAAMAGLAEATPEDPNEAPGERLQRMERNNAKRQAKVLVDRSPILQHMIHQHKVKVVAAFYDLGSGIVEFID